MLKNQPIDRNRQQLGYEVIKYMGIKPDLSGYTGVEVESS